jgi:NADPH:quinone reductase-like Zn-dependent oxidoreductase
MADKNPLKTMRTLRFHQLGEPGEVLRLEEAAVPEPGKGQIRVRVHACGLNPADWALCRGLFAGNFPRGVGLDVSGTVDAVGEGVTGVDLGDEVLGVPDYQGYPTAGASDYAVLSVWTSVPQGLNLNAAAALPMAIETAYRAIDLLAVEKGQTLFVYGAGTMIGFAAVQMARLREARVIAAAGETFASGLRSLGATVTPYGEGMVDRVHEIAGGAPDLIFDAGPISDVLSDLVRIAQGDARRVLTISNHGPAAKALGVRDSFAGKLQYDKLGEFVRLAATGRFNIPIARTFALENWRDALEVSLAGRARGKLLLLIDEGSNEGAIR